MKYEIQYISGEYTYNFAETNHESNAIRIRDMLRLDGHSARINKLETTIQIGETFGPIESKTKKKGK